MIDEKSTIFICRIDRDLTSEQEEMLMQIISSERAERLRRFRRRDDLLRGLTAEVLLRYAIDLYSIPIGSFIKNKYGKPYDEKKRFYFNISHSGDYVALIFGKTENGIDIEAVSDGYIEFCDRVLMQSEYEMLLNTDKAARDEVFMRCWTAKEAYLKYKGIGISAGLKSVGLLVDKGFSLIGCEEKTRFFQKRIADDYILSACFEGALNEEIKEIDFRTAASVVSGGMICDL